MNIILIGFMGSGKSHVAQALGRLLPYTVVEMDAIVCAKTGCQTMHEVFAKGGELLLRETEIAIAREYASQQNLVVSTGGGVVLNQIILNLFKQKGKIFFLHVPFAQIVHRLRDDATRPLFCDSAQAQKHYALRLPLYMHYADHVIDAENDSAEKIAAHIRPLA